MILDALRKAWLDVSSNGREPVKITMSRKALNVLKKHAKGLAIMGTQRGNLPRDLTFRGAKCVARGKSRISDLRFDFEFADGKHECRECFLPPRYAVIKGFKCE